MSDQAAAPDKTPDKTPGKDVEEKREDSLSALSKFEREFENFISEHRPRNFDWPFRRADWPHLRSKVNARLPNVDVIEREKDILIRAELPGFKKDEIDISLNDNSLTIKASTESKSTEEEGDYFCREISQEYVSRTVSLPARVLGEQVKAKLNDGVLDITVPKSDESNTQKITIES